MKRALTKRALLSALFLGAVAALGGCPIYSHDDDGCWRDRDCASGYLCDDSTGDCYAPNAGSDRCARPSDCGINQTCGSKGLCVSGDCSFSGCVSGYRCDARSGIWQCVSSDNTANAGGAGTTSGTGAGGDSSAASGAAGESGGG